MEFVILWLLLKNSAPWWMYLIWVLGCIHVSFDLLHD